MLANVLLHTLRMSHVVRISLLLFTLVQQNRTLIFYIIRFHLHLDFLGYAPFPQSSVRSTPYYQATSHLLFTRLTTTMATTPIAGLWASWTNLNEVVDVEKYATPQTMQWTKKQVRDQFQSKDLPPISCPHLPAPSIPAAIATINESRNNAPAIEYYTSQNPFWLAHRILFQAQF